MGVISAILSNSVEVLFEHLKQNLFSEEVPTENRVFSENILIAPSNGMHQWIQTRLASDLGIACGIQTTFLDQGIAAVRSRLFEPHEERAIPTRLELVLEIESAIQEAHSSANPLWEPLRRYVNGKQSRQTALALYLAELFEKYGVYAGAAALDWEKKPQHWQELLWSQVFEKWDYPQRALHHLQPQNKIKSGMSVHLFAFSHISPLYFHFFRQASKYIPVHLYQLSPCQEFWSDLPGDHPSLLGPLGKVGRAAAKQLEESGIPLEENYIQWGGETQLRRLQRGLLTLETLEDPRDDASIQITRVTTPRQEILYLHHQLVEMMSREKIEPRDVLVMAPNISVYAPYIRAIFGKQIDYQIADMPLHAYQPAVEAFFLLLDLERKRWSAPAVLELFEHPLFRAKWRLDSEELQLLKTWVIQTGIRWGVNGAHRAHLLQKRASTTVPQEEGATWLEGLGQLVDELALAHNPPRVDFTQAETLGKAIEAISTLHHDVKQLDTEKTLPEWIAFLKGVAETHFALTEEREPLFNLFVRLEKASTHFAERRYPFTLIYTLLKENAGSESITVNRNQLQTVRFCSMLPMRAIPSRVVCMLGMNHDAFPRRDQLQGLDHLGTHPKCSYCPTRVDFDRSLFLEAILSAREKLLISYQGRNPLDLTEIPPSSVVAQLLPFVAPRQHKTAPVNTLESVRIVPKRLVIPVEKPLELPQGLFHITVNEWIRLARSPLSHYLYQHDMKIGAEEVVEDEETFLLTPARRAQLRKEALHAPPQSVFKKIAREGNFPLGAFGKLAALQIQEEIEELPQVTLSTVALMPFTFALKPELKITCTGSLEGVFEQGLCVPGKCDFRTAAKAWPLLLLLAANDSARTTVLFAAADESKRFSGDPIPHLKNWMEYYFYAQQNPLLFALEWIEHILKQDAKKMAQAMHYDAHLEWYLRGKGGIDCQEWIATYHPLVKKVYGAMADAWF